MQIQAYALSQVPRSGDQADAGRCQVCWRYTECAQCFGWVPPGIQSTCFCSLLRHLTYFQIRALNLVCTNRAAQNICIALFRIFLLGSIALACLLRYTHFGFTEMFHLRIIVISSQSFFDGSSDFECRYRQHFLPIFGLLVHIPTAFFVRCWRFCTDTDSTFNLFLTDFRIFCRFFGFFDGISDFFSVFLAIFWRFFGQLSDFFGFFFEFWRIFWRVR